MGGIDSGSPIAAGPVWRRSDLAGGSLRAHASAAMSVGLDTEVDAGLRMPAVGTHRLAVEVSAVARHLAGERFYGLGGSRRRTIGRGSRTIAANWRRRRRSPRHAG